MSEDRKLCPHCNGTTLDLSSNEDGGGCPHCFGGYVEDIQLSSKLKPETLERIRAGIKKYAGSQGMETLPEQARRLSSGTMASLTGKTLYLELDLIQLDFVEFCEENEGKFETWATAWESFKKHLQL